MATPQPATTTKTTRTRKPAAARVIAVTPATPAPKVARIAARRSKAAAAPTAKLAKPAKVEKPQTLAQLTARAKREQYEKELLFQIGAVLHLPKPQEQALWHPTINYRADLLFCREHLIVEVDGGVYLRHGHHNSGKGYEYDRVRDAEALTLGYTVLRVTPGMVKDGTAITYVERVLHAIWARTQRTA